MQKRLRSISSLCFTLASALLLSAAPLAAKATSTATSPAPDEGPFAALVRSAPPHSVTPDQIHAAFVKQIERNFSGAHGRAITRRLTDKELADVASRYDALNGNVQAPVLLDELVANAENTDLVRLSNAFGLERVHQLVRVRATPSVAMAYERWYSATPKAATLPTSNAVMIAAAGPAPTVDMTIEEIYLEFRTAPVGSLSVEGSLAEAGIFMASRLTPAALVGAAVGAELNQLIDTYDPSLGDAIGGTEYNIMQAVSAAQGDFAQGRYEQSIDDLFGSSIQDSRDWSGDWDVSYSMSVYMGVPGCTFCIYNPE
jgi:hypothetical protein